MKISVTLPSFSSGMKKYIPLTAAAIILLVIVLLAPWSQIGALLADIPLAVFFGLFVLSLVYFLSKALRFGYILAKLGIGVPIGKVIPLYIAGQPFSFLPAGEFYRTLLLEKYCGVKVSHSAPSVTIQGLVEAIILLSFSLVGAFAIGQNRVVVGLVALSLVLLLVILRRGWLVGKHRIINKIPFISIREEKYHRFIKSHQKLMAPSTLINLCILSLMPVLAGIFILFISALVVNADLNLTEAVVSYCVPVVLSGLSFLPGGIGVGEGSTIGFLHIFGVSAAKAITITLLVRVFTFVIGIVYGLIAQLYIHRRYD